MFDATCVAAAGEGVRAEGGADVGGGCGEGTRAHPPWIQRVRSRSCRPPHTGRSQAPGSTAALVRMAAPRLRRCCAAGFADCRQEGREEERREGEQQD